MKRCKDCIAAGVVTCLVATTAYVQGQQVALPGVWKISPYVDIRGVYDDNIDRLPENETDDFFADTTAGLRLGYSGSILDLFADGFVSRRSYNDTSEKDFTSAGQSLRLLYGSRDQVEVELTQAFRRIDDADRYGSDTVVGGVSPDSAIDAASRRERTILQASIRAGKNLTDKSEIDASYRFDSVDYRERGLLTLRTHTAQIEGATKVTDKTSALLILKGGLQDSESVDDDADFYSASLGVKTQGSDKLQLRASGGFQQYNRPNGDDIDSFVYNLQALLALTEKLSLRVGARNGTQLSSLFAGNATEFDVVWAGAFLRVTDTVMLSANVAYREDEYLDPVVVGTNLVDRKDKATALRVRGDYRTPAELLSLYAEATYETVDSNVREYDQTQVALGFNLQF